LITHIAFAIEGGGGGNVGNGGLAVVCRDPQTHLITHAELFDYFEARQTMPKLILPVASEVDPYIEAERILRNIGKFEPETMESYLEGLALSRSNLQPQGP
jgi:hypothetical protein